jgi:hypothetical protein
MTAPRSDERGDVQRLLPRTDTSPLQRLDQLIDTVQGRLVEQEAAVREASLISGSTAVASFELEKMHLLVALLREGRQRITGAAAE